MLVHAASEGRKRNGCRGLGTKEQHIASETWASMAITLHLAQGRSHWRAFVWAL
jgi:hypothetical protein